MEKSKSKLIFFIPLLSSLLLMSFSGNVFGRDNFALSVGTESGIINTKQDVIDAGTSYANAGYESYGILDPSAQRLWELLYADVQFFSAHGSSNNVQFNDSGIITGNTGEYFTGDKMKTFIGTNDVHWDADTILVTYSSCESGGIDAEDGTHSFDSITALTAKRGADVAVGFTEKINAGSSRNWSERYNRKLGEGYGVADAIRYANSFTYLYPSVKKSVIWNHGDDNIKIGRYRHSVNYEKDIRNILANKKECIKNNLYSIENVIKEKNQSFDLNNYEIIERSQVLSNSIDENGNFESTKVIAEYIDLQLKVGDFYTESGYTIEIMDNYITGIYDNTKNLEKENMLINSKKAYSTSQKNDKVEELKDIATKKLLDECNNITIDYDNISYIYYLDIMTDKQYIIFTIPNNIGGEQLNALSYNNVKIEI